MIKTITSIFAALLFATIASAHCGSCGVGDAKCGSECPADCSKCAEKEKPACKEGCEGEKCTTKATASEGEQACKAGCEDKKCSDKKEKKHDHAEGDHAGHSH